MAILERNPAMVGKSINQGLNGGLVQITGPLMSNQQVKRSEPSAARVLLVSLPWTSLNEPSLGLSLLRAVLDEEGITCRVLHLNLFALEFLQSKTYDAIAQVYALNDFVFSGLLDPTVTARQMRLLREKCTELVGQDMIDHRQYGGIPGIVDKILRLRSDIVPQWMERKVDEIIAWQPTLVGFTCMFDQTIASAAMSSILKRKYPKALIAFGGYAVRSPTAEMLLESFPWIDAVCAGEGEPCITRLARASVEDSPNLAAVPNLFFRDSDGKIVESERAKSVDLNTLPSPNFDDFYNDIRRLRRECSVEVAVDRLPIENSRGCWWGAKHHCVFCGIHDNDLVYRSRNADAVLQSMDELSEKYGTKEFRFADYILPQQYYSTLLPQLIDRGTPYHIKCELKANISETQFKLLTDAGFVEVQPGIESFCSDTLKKLDKGVSGMQNVYLLLLARRHGIVILYNILYGLPNDDPDKYEQMRRALPHLIHLDPPTSRVRIQITRFAPLQVSPARFGFTQPLRHEFSYDLIFSEDYLRHTGFDLERYCYIFEHPFEPAPRLSRTYREIDRLCDEWNEAYSDRNREVDLLYESDGGDGLLVRDSRQLPARTHKLNAAEAAVLIAAESPKTTSSVRNALTGIGSAAIDEALKRLDALGLLFQEDEKILSLALPREKVAPRRYWWNNYETRWQKMPDQLVAVQ